MVTTSKTHEANVGVTNTPAEGEARVSHLTSEQVWRTLARASFAERRFNVP